MGDLHTLWDIGEESFRTLVGAQFRTSPPAAVTASELKMRMLGDGLVPHPTRTLMRSVQIDADASGVWPWLVQMMRGAGVYGWPTLETAHCRSADFLLEGLPAARSGDRVGDVFELASVDPAREVVWQSIGPMRLLGFTMAALTLDYLLQPQSEGRCLLVVRLQGSCAHLISQIAHYLFEVIDFLLPAVQLPTLKSYVESYEQRRSNGNINRSCVRCHQAAEFHPAAPQAVQLPDGPARPQGASIR